MFFRLFWIALLANAVVVLQGAEAVGSVASPSPIAGALFANQRKEVVVAFGVKYHEPLPTVRAQEIRTWNEQPSGQEYSSYLPNYQPSLYQDNPFFQESSPYLGDPWLDSSAATPSFTPAMQDQLMTHESSRSESVFVRTGKRELGLYWEDAKNFYTWSNAGNYGVMLLAMGIVANTSLDQQVADWYQKDVRSKTTDNISKIFEKFGRGEYAIPIFVVGSLVFSYFNESIYGQNSRSHGEGDEAHLFGSHFFSRTARAMVIGLPTLAIGQVSLGGGRPSFGSGSSHWIPFKYYNAVSGHAYVGAVPFITLAQMSDNLWLKSIFYFGSTLTAWSRVNDNRHYLSQVVLGWYMAYLSVRATSETEDGPLPRGLTIFPIISDESTSFGFSYSY